MVLDAFYVLFMSPFPTRQPSEPRRRAESLTSGCFDFSLTGLTDAVDVCYVESVSVECVVGLF